jgi:YafQ family addiction module toxin component
MPYNFKFSKHFERILRKLIKKDKSLHVQIINKIDEIIKSFNIENYKNLRYNMKDSKRVHIGHFVLIFQFNKDANTVLFEDFDHHDNIYKKK